MRQLQTETRIEDDVDDDAVIGCGFHLSLEDGVLYLELANLADRPALNVSCSFEPTLVDAQGRDVSKLILFRRVEFLGPRRRIRTMLDSSARYFARAEATRLTVAVEYERPGEPRRTTQVGHDLGVFGELAYVT